jgi:hypothetical protein
MESFVGWPASALVEKYLLRARTGVICHPRFRAEIKVESISISGASIEDHLGCDAAGADAVLRFSINFSADFIRFSLKVQTAIPRGGVAVQVVY